MFENWDRETYEGWSATGNAFGSGPTLKSKMPDYQGDVGGPGKRVANSHATAPGGDVGEKDNQIGTLTSREFTIERDYITFWIGGGSHAGTTCLNLLVDGKVALTATGRNDNRMRLDQFDVRHLQGQAARLQIVDNQTGAWGNIGVGEIVLSDKPAEAAGEVRRSARLWHAWRWHCWSPVPQTGVSPRCRIVPFRPNSSRRSRTTTIVSKPFGQQLRGGLARTQPLAAGEETTVTFLAGVAFSQ